MSVIKMKKLTVFAHARDADRLLRRLMRCRCVDVASDAAEAAGLSVNVCEAERIEQQEKMDRITAALAYLHKHSGKAPLVKQRQAVENLNAFL